MVWLFASGGQSIGASASASVLPMSIEGYSQGNPKFPLGFTFVSLVVQGTLKRFLFLFCFVFLQNYSSNASFL